MDIIIGLLKDIMPVGYIVILVSFYLVIRFYYTRFRPIEDKLGKIEGDVRKMEGDVRKIDAGIAEIKELVTKDVSHLRTEVGNIKTFLITKHKLKLDLFSMKNSPRKLNPTGLQLYADCKGEDFLSQNRKYLFGEIDRYKPQTALDVENFANLVCNEATSLSMFNRLKNFVYNYPTIKAKDSEGNAINYDVDLSDLCFVLSLPLRDMYLAEHPEISTE